MHLPNTKNRGHAHNSFRLKHFQIHAFKQILYLERKRDSRSYTAFKALAGSGDRWTAYTVVESNNTDASLCVVCCNRLDRKRGDTEAIAVTVEVAIDKSPYTPEIFNTKCTPNTMAASFKTVFLPGDFFAARNLN